MAPPPKLPTEAPVLPDESEATLSRAEANATAILAQRVTAESEVSASWLVLVDQSGLHRRLRSSKHTFFHSDMVFACLLRLQSRCPGIAALA